MLRLNYGQIGGTLFQAMSFEISSNELLYDFFSLTFFQIFVLAYNWKLMAGGSEALWEYTVAGMEVEEGGVWDFTPREPSIPS